MAKSDKLLSWLSNSTTESKDKKYIHRLLKEDSQRRCEVLEELKLLIQQAHKDARNRLRKLAGVSLDPLGTSPEYDPAQGYPERLHIQTLKGYFGEVFAGLLAETFLPFGCTWEVPAFLFRFHLVEFQQLEKLNQMRGEAQYRPGRTGDDCLAFERNNKGQIIRALYCEAKCTSGHDSGLINEAFEKVSEAAIVDILQLVEILMDCNDPGASQWVISLQQLWFILQSGDTQKSVERCDLVSYVCGQPPVRGNRSTWLPVDKPHSNYKGERRLEAVEIHLQDVEDLIRTVYGKMDDDNGSTT